MGVMKEINTMHALGKKYPWNPRPAGGERELPLFDGQPPMKEIESMTVGTSTLWPNAPSGSPLKIEVFGATGAFQSGKTILGLSIAPGAHPAGHAYAGKPRTLYLDFEKSGATYGGTGCHRVDVHEKLTEIHKGKPYGPDEVYGWFTNVVIGQLPVGQFDVLVADPITDVESGLVNWVRKHPDQFGYTAAQFTKAGGLFWGAVKDCWKQVLLQLTAKVECFFFTSHLRAVWEGDRPVKGKQEPKGKETLMELASLYLWLDRSPDDKGIVPDVPSATVLKQRLADTVVKDGQLQVVPLLPPHLPKATVEAIRGYISKPPDYKKLKVGERVIEKPLSEEDKAQIALATAEANRDAEQSRLAWISRQAELQMMAREAADLQPQTPDQSAVIVQERQQRAAAAEPETTQEEVDAAVQEATEAAAAVTAKGEALKVTGVEGSAAPADQPQEQQPQDERKPEPAETEEPKCSPEQIDEVKKLVIALQLDPKIFQQKILAKAGAKKVAELSVTTCNQLIEFLQAEVDKRKN